MARWAAKITPLLKLFEIIEMVSLIQSNPIQYKQIHLIVAHIVIANFLHCKHIILLAEIIEPKRNRSTL